MRISFGSGARIKFETPKCVALNLLPHKKIELDVFVICQLGMTGASNTDLPQRNLFSGRARCMLKRIEVHQLDL